METIKKTVVIEATCESCRYYYPAVSQDANGETFVHTFGECRRFPPRRVDSLSSGFPIVEEDLYCGEYKIAKKILPEL